MNNDILDQILPVPLEFDVDIVQTLSKCTTVTTSDYTPEDDWEEETTTINTEYTDWKEAYEKEHKTIKQLLNECSKMAQEFYDMYKDQPRTKEHTKLMKKYLNIIEECKGWVIEDYYVEH